MSAGAVCALTQDTEGLSVRRIKAHLTLREMIAIVSMNDLYCLHLHGNLLKVKPNQS